MLHSNVGLRKRFQTETFYLDSIDPELFKNRFHIPETDIRKYIGLRRKTSKLTSYPRDYGEDPWHVMDFSEMMEFAATRKPKEGKKVGYMTDGHFVPYYHQKGISPCTMQYDVVIKQEFFGQEFGHLLGKTSPIFFTNFCYQHRCSSTKPVISDKVDIELPDDLDPRKSMFHSNSESKVKTSPEEVKEKLEALKVNFKKHWDRVDIDVRKKIFEIYKQDLDMFGYYWDYKTNEIDFEIVNK